MVGYLLRRFVQALVVVVGVSILTFLLLQVLPGGPRALLGPRATPQAIHQFIVANGLNRPVWVQYGDYVDRLVHGNLGYSYHYNESVNSLLASSMLKSAVLVGSAMVIALLIAIPLGIFQAVKRNSVADYALTGASFVGYSMPVFWLGILLVGWFSLDFHLLPAEAPQGGGLGAIVSQPTAMVLPVVTLAAVLVALFSRYMRSSALENLVQDYIEMARAKGVPERQVVRRHLVRNSLVPIATLVGLSLPQIFSGALVTESVFNYPGMGLLFWNAAQVKDYSVLLGVILVVSIAAVVGSLLADVLYVVLDPRVRLG